MNMGKRLGFDNCMAVSRNGMGGGLALLWNDDLELEIVSYSNHHIDGLVKGVDGKLWRCTGIYGHPEVNQKRHTWTLIKRLSGLFSYLWICCSDFNEILNLAEKTGGNDRNLSMVADFKAAVEECHLTDVECRGYPFTWSNRRFGPYFVEEKLDRFLGTKDWEKRLTELVAYNLDTCCSDHTPIMLKLQARNRGVSFKQRSKARIHYEDLWSTYDECKRIVNEEWGSAEGWNRDDHVQYFKKIANSSMAQLQTWSKQQFRNSKEKLKQWKRKLREMKLNGGQYEAENELRSTEKRIENLLMDEEVY